MRSKVVREERGTAIAVGGLYVLATAAGVAALLVGAPTEASAMADRSGAVLVTALLVAVMAVAVAGVGVMFYPVLARDAGGHAWRGAAFGFAGARVAEGAIFLVYVAAIVAVLGLGEAFSGAEGIRAAAYEAAGLALQTFSQYAMIAAQTAFCVGAAVMYVLLYRSRRVPRWLSVWGLVATPLMLVAGFTLPFTNDPNSTVSTVLYMPMAVQEMVLAVWLIAFGLRPAVATAAVIA
jgi:hypothetical protein